MSCDRLKCWSPRNIALVCAGSVMIAILLMFGALTLVTGAAVMMLVMTSEPTPLTREYIETATLLIVVGFVAEVAVILVYRSLRRWWKNRLQPAT
jgi:hypothetical protein